MEYDPRNATSSMRTAPTHMFTEDAVDRMVSKAFFTGALFGFVAGLMVAAIYFAL